MSGYVMKYCTRFEKYPRPALALGLSKKLDIISLVYPYLYDFVKKILSLALKNIQASLIFLARLSVSLQ